MILDYIDTKYSSLKEEYRKIYIPKDYSYWNELGQFLQDYVNKMGIKGINYFYHEKLVKEKCT